MYHARGNSTIVAPLKENFVQQVHVRNYLVWQLAAVLQWYI
jgi:hypothetical protein